MTNSQAKWYQSCLSTFAQPGNRYDAIPRLTWCAVRLGIPTEQVIADAQAVGVTNRNADIRRGMMSAAAKVGSRPTTDYAPRRREARQTFPDYVRGLIRDGGGVANFDALRALSPVNLSALQSPQAQTAAFLSALYTPHDYLHIFANDRHRRGEIGRDILTRDECLERIRRAGDLGGDCIGKNPLTGRQGTNGKGEPSFTSQDCIAAYRYALIEFDALPLQEQCAFWAGWLRRPNLAPQLAALTFSGGKSIHGLVRTGAESVTAPTIERNLRDLLCTATDKRYCADTNTLKPHGGTRLAGATRHINDKQQELLYLSH